LECFYNKRQISLYNIPYTCLSVHVYQRGSTGRIFPKFDIGDFYENLLSNSKLV